MAVAKKKTAAKKEKPVASTDLTVKDEATAVATSQHTPMAVNVDIADMKRPLVKLIQETSPEVKELGVEPGNFFATVINQDLGTEFTATILGYKKRFILWNPQRNVEPMVLARSENCVTWGEGEEDQTFDVNIPQVGKVKWFTGKSVADSGLHLFGSSVPSNPKSKPAAAETHDFLLHIHGEGMPPVGISLSRSKLDCAKSLLTIGFGDQKTDPRSLKIKFRAVEDNRPSGDFMNIKAMRFGKVTAEEYEEMVMLSEKFKGFSLDVDLDENRGGEGGVRRERAPRDPNAEREY